MWLNDIFDLDCSECSYDYDYVYTYFNVPLKKPIPAFETVRTLDKITIDYHKGTIVVSHEGKATQLKAQIGCISTT